MAGAVAATIFGVGSLLMGYRTRRDSRKDDPAAEQRDSYDRQPEKEKLIMKQFLDKRCKAYNVKCTLKCDPKEFMMSVNRERTVSYNPLYSLSETDIDFFLSKDCNKC